MCWLSPGKRVRISQSGRRTVNISVYTSSSHRSRLSPITRRIVATTINAVSAAHGVRPSSSSSHHDIIIHLARVKFHSSARTLSDYQQIGSLADPLKQIVPYLPPV